MDDRRRLNPRLEAELSAEYRVERSDPPWPGTTANLSVGGAAVLTGRQLPGHTLLERFRFSLPTEKDSDTTLEASAAVVHAHPYLNDRGNIEYCSGLHFLGLEDSAFQHLEKFVLDRLEAPEA